MGRASSSKKVARVAKVGGKAGHRTSRSYGYPLSVAALIVIGLALVSYVKVNRTAVDNTPPRAPVVNANGQVTRVGDHYHEAFGIYVCGKWVPNLTDVSGQGASGIHTLGDGIISIQPSSSEYAGENAQLKLFLNDVGVKLTDDSLTLPSGVKVTSSAASDPVTATLEDPAGTTTSTTAPPATSTTAPTTTSTSAPAPATTTTTVPPQTFTAGGSCHGKPAVLRVGQWTQPFQSDGRTPTKDKPSKVYSDGFGSIRLDKDLGALTVYYGPEDGTIPVPKSTKNLLHLQDIGGQSPTSTTPSTGVTVAPGTSTPASSAPATSTPASSTSASSTPASTPSTTTQP